MAGEYSRELSTKVFAGQCRLIELGYRQGGPAGFGLRRVLVDERGDFKAELRRGEHKSLQTDRVVLTVGPPGEVEIIRWIYEQFVQHGRTEGEIAGDLNTQGILTDLGRHWTRSVVQQILTNEKYIGNNIYNRKSFKLKRKRVVNAPDMWIRANGAFEAIIAQDTFLLAQQIIANRNQRFTDAEMIEHLRALFQKHGFISGFVIDEADGLPSSAAYKSRFGSLLRAYELVGFQPDKDYRYLEINRALRALHSDIVDEAVRAISNCGGSVEVMPKSGLLRINREFTVSIVIARCKPTGAGSSRWRIRFDTAHAPDITLAIRMDRQNEKALDYYVLPQVEMNTEKLGLSEENGLMLDSYRFDTPEFLFALSARSRFSEVMAW